MSSVKGEFSLFLLNGCPAGLFMKTRPAKAQRVMESTQHTEPRLLRKRRKDRLPAGKAGLDLVMDEKCPA